MPEAQTSAVLVGPERIELRQFPIPEPADDDGVLRMEVIGVCGSDVSHFRRGDDPAILGHEIVGSIVDLGHAAQEAWGVKPGDRVVVETTFGCGRCEDLRLVHAVFHG